jgi:hypothetical protein
MAARQLFARLLLGVFLGASLVLAGGVAAEASVLRYDTAEVVLHAASSYDANQGSPNPFTDIDLTLAVTAPDGRHFTVDGFFDGDGGGGPAGDVFKARIFADQAGPWTWVSQSGESSLNGVSGGFTCSGTLSGVFGQGPIERDPQHPRAFRHRDAAGGSAVYLLGKFLDKAAPVPIRFSHTMFSELRTDDDRRALIDRHLGMGLNKVNVYLANQVDYGSIPTTPWVGTADANDKSRFDLERWHLYEKWVRQMRDQGLAIQLWFFADSSGYGDLPAADRNRLIRYGMARLSGYANTMFTLMTEWQEGWTAVEVDDHMTFLQAHNPWDRLATVHGVPGDFSFPSASWADYLDLQAGLGTAVNSAFVHELGLKNRTAAAKPLIQEEFCQGAETDEERKMVWAAFTAGAAGLGTGGYLQPFSQFVATVPFERMAPADDLALAGQAYVLAEEGSAYVGYLYEGGNVDLDLTAVTGKLAAVWFDPRTGTFQGSSEVVGGAIRSFTAPGAGDWVLRLLALVEPPPEGGGFVPLAPCRLWDTRASGQGPALLSGEQRDLALLGRCGIPAAAGALALNVTVVGPAGKGNLRFGPGGAPLPQASTINFEAGGTRSNAAILALAADGSGVLRIGAFVAGGGGVDMVLDVTGYFER